MALRKGDRTNEDSGLATESTTKEWGVAAKRKLNALALRPKIQSGCQAAPRGKTFWRAGSRMVRTGQGHRQR